MKKTIITLTLCILVIIFLVFYYQVQFKPGVIKPKTTSAPTPTLLTYAFNGTIDKIEQQSFVIVGTPLLNSATPSAKIAFKVNIDKDTNIYLPSVQYSFKRSFADLKTGQTVMVLSLTDFKNTKVSEVTAKAIMLPPALIRSIKGKIENITGNTLTVKNETKSWEINLNDETEIFFKKAEKTEKAKISDLKNNQEITAYIEDDLNVSKQIKVLRIDMII